MIKTEMFDKDGNPINAKIMPDGGRLRTHMTLMDAAHPDIAAITRAAMTDADRDLADIRDIMDITRLADRQPTVTVARHRPGSAVLTDTDRDAREQALAARDARLVSAWKSPPAVDAAQIEKPAPTTPTGDPADRRDARLRDAWRN